MPKLLHDTQSIFRPDFMLHPIQMILHRLFRQAKMIRNLFIREPLRDQRHDLLLPPCNPNRCVGLPNGNRGSASSKNRNNAAQSSPGQTAFPACTFRFACAMSSAEASRHKYPLMPARTYCRNSASSFADPNQTESSAPARFRGRSDLLHVRLNAPSRDISTRTSIGHSELGFPINCAVPDLNEPSTNRRLTQDHIDFVAIRSDPGRAPRRPTHLVPEIWTRIFVDFELGPREIRIDRARCDLLLELNRLSCLRILS